jgi:hypothetical protein
VETESFATEELKKYYDITEPRRNFKSTEENAILFEREIVRLNKEGFVDVFPTWKDLLRAEPEVIVSKVAALTKQREDGTIKLRIIVDMLRSMVNAFVKFKERIVLPRLFDIVVNLMLLMSVAAGSCDDIVEMLVMDWSDAFHTIEVMAKERAYQVFKGPNRSFVRYRTVVFGGGGAPLIWGRVAALLGRSGQSLFSDQQVRIEIYVDDPWSAWRGSRHTIRRLQARLLAWWATVGLDFSWSKAQRGKVVKWIGALIKLEPSNAVTIELPQAFADEMLAEIRELIKLATAPVTRLRKLTGKASWMSGFVPCVASMIAPLWTVVSGHSEEEDVDPATAQVTKRAR